MESEIAEGAEPIVNAMTVDVEDYFHVSVFDGLIPRHEWASMESRVCANTERILSIFDEEGITATFFVLGWVAERFPRLVRDIAARGHEIASHGFADVGFRRFTLGIVAMHEARKPTQRT